MKLEAYIAINMNDGCGFFNEAPENNYISSTNSELRQFDINGNTQVFIGKLVLQKQYYPGSNVRQVNIANSSLTGYKQYIGNGPDLSFQLSGISLTGTDFIKYGEDENIFLDYILRGDDNISGSNQSDTLLGGKGNDLIYGYGGADSLSGGDGNDQLDGGDGADSMTGGKGDDIYFVNDQNDVVIEASGAGSGVDTVRSFITYTLGSNLENLVLLGTANNDGTGNEFNNVLNGNSGNNLLQGLDGNDSIYGGAGDDNIVGGKGNDNLFGDGGVDILTGIDLSDPNLGRGSVDKITGGTQADTFVLGNAQGVFYNDGNSGSAGTSDYAWITDFKASDGDKIQLSGQNSDYVLNSMKIGSTTGMGIYLNNGSSSGWDSKDELVGFIQGYTNKIINSDFTFIPQQIP